MVHTLMTIWAHDIVRGLSIMPRHRRQHGHRYDRTGITPRSDTPLLAGRTAARHLRRLEPEPTLVPQMVGGVSARSANRFCRSSARAAYLAAGPAAVRDPR